MALWIKSYADLAEHHKTKKLVELLDIDIPTAIGHLHLLWHFSLRNAWRDGDLSHYTLKAIAQGAEWTGDPDKFISALRESRFLDNMKIHDWLDYCGELVHKRLRYEREKDEKRRKNIREVSDNSPTQDGQIEENSRHRINKNRKENNSPTNTDKSLLTPKWLMNEWNSMANGLPKARELTKKRRWLAEERLSERPDRNFWIQAIKKMNSSDYCTASKWASFDWLIKEETNAVKAFEGNYDNNNKQEVPPWNQAKKK